MTVPPLRLVALEITRTCSLACRHCRGDSCSTSYPDELSLKEIKSILDNIASFSQPIIIITGGEPLHHPGVFDIIAYSTSLGLRTVLATCGHELNDETVQKLISTGVSRISVSLDGALSATHDSFRGVPGAFEAALKGLKTLRKYGLDFQINSTLTTMNTAELEALHDLAVQMGAVGFHPFLLVPVGRGKDLTDYALSGEDYETTLIRIFEIAVRSPIEIKPTCSPHYNRVVRQMSINSSILPEKSNASEALSRLSSSHSYLKGSTARCTAKQRSRPVATEIRLSGHIMTKGCLGGQGFVFISHVGKVQMCGFLEIEAGDLRAVGYDLRHIWVTSDFFNEIRDIDNYHGKCGVCEYRYVCGGCRARAYYTSGDYLGEEPNCIYIPEHSD